MTVKNKETSSGILEKIQGIGSAFNMVWQTVFPEKTYTNDEVKAGLMYLSEQIGPSNFHGVYSLYRGFAEDLKNETIITEEKISQIMRSCEERISQHNDLSIYNKDNMQHLVKVRISAHSDSENSFKAREFDQQYNSQEQRYSLEG